jgi:hypothetical protein
VAIRSCLVVVVYLGYRRRALLKVVVSIAHKRSLVYVAAGI